MFSDLCTQITLFSCLSALSSQFLVCLDLPIQCQCMKKVYIVTFIVKKKMFVPIINIIKVGSLRVKKNNLQSYEPKLL